MLNKYLWKTIFKGSALRRIWIDTIYFSGINSKPLLMINKRTFLNFSEKNKNIFDVESSDEEAAKNNKATKNQKDQKYQRNDFDKNKASKDQNTEGKYEVKDIPLYMYKMKEEIKAKKIDPENKLTYFRKIENLFAMLHTNQARIIVEYPRFQFLLYDYLSFKGMK